MIHYYYSKKAKFLTLFITLLTLNIYSQCLEMVTNFGNNSEIPSYNISGDVSVTLNADNTITLDLASNFNTTSGPDVRAYLINTNGTSDNAIANTNIENLESIEFGLVSCTSACSPSIDAAGEKTFTVDIPENVDIKNYDRLLFYCLQFNQFWDFGSFNAFDSNSCAILSTEEESFSSVDVYPNPATTTIQVSTINAADAEISIFDFSGKKVLKHTNINHQNTIDVSSLKAGIYVVSITEDHKRTSKKLVIR